MPAKSTLEETALIDAAITWLVGALPTGWTVERSTRLIQGQVPSLPHRPDGALDIRASNGMTATMAIEAKSSFTPRDAERLVDGLSGVLRNLAVGVSILVVASWLSPRSRELLEAQGINYLDVTGNVLLQTENPTIFLRAQGAKRDPIPTRQGQAQLRGPKAGRVVRLLTDIRPPYRVREIAVATGVATGYVSKVLETLDRQALIEREPRGPVEAVNIAGLLRRYVESYNVLKNNAAATFLAPAGAADALRRLPDLPGRYAVTGSFAAVRLAPIAAPSLLMAYTNDIEKTAAALDLLPADSGANVALLAPYDPVVWEHTTTEDGVRYAAPTQVAMDCLSGNGRMPAEGEAVLGWLTENERSWRSASLDGVDYTP